MIYILTVDDYVCIDRYSVYFFGTKETGTLTAESMWHYTPETKAKIASRHMKKEFYSEGIDQIENARETEMSGGDVDLNQTEMLGGDVDLDQTEMLGGDVGLDQTLKEQVVVDRDEGGPDESQKSIFQIPGAKEAQHGKQNLGPPGLLTIKQNGKQRRKSCGSCESCLAPPCGECTPCKQK